MTVLETMARAANANATASDLNVLRLRLRTLAAAPPPFLLLALDEVAGGREAWAKAVLAICDE